MESTVVIGLLATALFSTIGLLATALFQLRNRIDALAAEMRREFADVRAEIADLREQLARMEGRLGAHLSEAHG